jgi:hypothetical protein
LSSNPSTTRKRQKGRREGRREGRKKEGGEKEQPFKLFEEGENWNDVDNPSGTAL